MGEPLFGWSSQVNYHHNGRQASSMISLWWSTWTCTPQSWWRSSLDAILHGLYDIFLLMHAHGNIPNPTKNPHIDHGLIQKAQWTMLTIPWDHLILLGTSCFLCVLINLNNYLYLVLINLVSFQLPSLRWCLEGKHECSHNLLVQDMLEICTTLTWTIFG